MTLDGFIRDTKERRAGAPQRVEHAHEAVGTVKRFMEKVWATKINELTQRSFGLRVHDGYQTPFVKLKDGNEAAIRRVATIEDEEYQLVAKTEDTEDPNYEGETYARIPVQQRGEPLQDAPVEYPGNVDISNIHVALAHDEEVAATFKEIVDTLQEQYPELQPEQPAPAV